MVCFFMHITCTSYSSCLQTVLLGYEFTKRDNRQLFKEKTGWRDRSREGDEEREGEREREIYLYIETKQNLLLENGLIVGSGSLSAGLPDIL